MKLSEAIRLGATLRPQAYGALVDGTGSCAMGAAYEAVGVKDLRPYGIDDALIWQEHQWGSPFVTTRPPRGCNCAPRFFGSLIAHLNDVHRWSREEIAAWVEQIEAPTEAQKQTADEPEVIAAS